MLVRRRKETERQTGGDSWKERKREREWECVTERGSMRVCVCVCESTLLHTYH